jgi:hypothetical protein
MRGAIRTEPTTPGVAALHPALFSFQPFGLGFLHAVRRASKIARDERAIASHPGVDDYLKKHAQGCEDSDPLQSGFSANPRALIWTVVSGNNQ